MEELIIQRNKNIQYEFYPDLIVIKKKDKVKREIKLVDVQKFFYSPKFRVKELLRRILVVLFASRQAGAIYWTTSVLSNSFEIFFKNSNERLVRKVILRIEPSDYEKVKEVLQIKEVGITGDL